MFVSNLAGHRLRIRAITKFRLRYSTSWSITSLVIRGAGSALNDIICDCSPLATLAQSLLNPLRPPSCSQHPAASGTMTRGHGTITRWFNRHPLCRDDKSKTLFEVLAVYKRTLTGPSTLPFNRAEILYRTQVIYWG